VKEAQRKSKEATKAPGLPQLTDRDNQKEKQETLSFSKEFTNEQVEQNIEAHKISTQMEVQCSLEKFWKIHEKDEKSLNEFFI
jgi:hypothetical protein